MNKEKQLKDKIKELKAIENIMIENLIISELKYSEYQDEQKKLEYEIKQLRENIKESNIRKTWIDIGDGWKQRVYK